MIDGEGAGARDTVARGGLVSPGVFSALAGAVMVTHFAVSVYIVFGGALAVWGPLAWWAHVPLAAWGVLAHGANLTCPLTPLEKRLRVLAGEEPYEAGFVARYLAPAGLTGRALDWSVVALILVVNGGIYGGSRF